MAHAAQDIIEHLGSAPLKMGAVKKLAAAIKTDHALAQTLWDTGDYGPRLVAVLIMDKKQLTAPVMDTLAADIETHPDDEMWRLSEWLMANQLMKFKPGIAALESWQGHASPVLRRLFWYHEARKRWVGQPSPDNTAVLWADIKAGIADEHPWVQWAMNFTACQIGLHDPEFRDDCIAFGTQLGLYADQKVPKNCAPNYIPGFIAYELAKRA